MILSSRELKFRRRLFLVCALIPPFLAVGLYAFWPSIQQEFQRRRWWENAMAWTEDAVALYWYLRFLIGFFADQHRDTHDVADAAREWRRVGLSMLLGAALSITAVVYAFHSEEAAYQRAAVTSAQGECTLRRSLASADNYKIICHFTDAAGNPHQFWIIAVDMRTHGPPGFSSDLVDALRRGDRQFTLTVRYDRDHPDRAWIDGTGGVDENGYPWMSLGVLMFQLFTLLLFALTLLPRLRDAGRCGTVPWWAPFYKVIPLAAEALCAGLFGLIELLMPRMQ